MFIHAGEEWRKIHGQSAKKVQETFERADSISQAKAGGKTMDDLRFCFQGCCRFINNRPVSDAEHQEFALRPVIGSLGPPVELLIPCRRNPGDLEKAVEDSVGFYLGSPMKRAFGTFLQAGRTFVIDGSTGARLREASEGDIKKWNEAQKAEIEKKKKGS